MRSTALACFCLVPAMAGPSAAQPSAPPASQPANSVAWYLANRSILQSAHTMCEAAKGRGEPMSQDCANVEDARAQVAHDRLWGAPPPSQSAISNPFGNADSGAGR
jgi:hypothetical protein